MSQLLWTDKTKVKRVMVNGYHSYSGAALNVNQTEVTLIDGNTRTSLVFDGYQLREITAMLAASIGMSLQ